MIEKRFYKEIKAIGIIAVAIGAILLFIRAMDNKNFERVFSITLISYLILFVLLSVINLKVNNKLLDKISQIILFPLGVLFAILTVILPFWALLIHLMLYFIIAFLIPELPYRALNYFHILDFLNEPTVLYLRITLTVLISVLFNPILRDIVCLISPVRIKTSKKLKPYKLDKLTDYFLSSENVRFLVYGAYVLALLITNYYYFQGLSFNKSTELDKALLQSFVTFIAFERAFSLMKQLNFRPSELLTKIYNSIVNKVDDLENKNSKQNGDE